METYSWYDALVKPQWAPPASVFGPAWSMLYALIAISFIFVLYQAYKGRIQKKTALPFVLNIIFNLLFTPIQFGLKNNLLAFIDIILVLGTLVWALVSIYPRYKWVAWINIPYLLWVSFATILQTTITILNW
jgi:benzodiazapine receptor